MRIAFLTDGISPYVLGGMQKYAYYLTKHLLRQGVAVDLYHVTPPEQQSPPFEALFEPEELSGLQSFAVPFPTTRYFPGHYLYRSWIHAEAVFEEFIRHPEVDFIYVNGFPGWKLLLEKHRGCAYPPIGVNFHGYEMFQPPAEAKERAVKAMFRPAVRANVRRADVVFSFGGKVREAVREIVGPTSVVLPVRNGVDLSWLRENDFELRRPRRFLFVGRYERRKGIEELNQGLTVLLKEPKLSFEFEFVGAMPERLQIRSDRIRYHGAIREEAVLREVYRQCDVLVCPSYSEGMPTVILEAMASGLAVIATDVGAVREMVSTRTGLLLEATVTANLVAAIRRFLSMDEAELIRRKQASVEQVRQQFTWPATAANWRRLVEAHLAGSGRRREQHVLTETRADA